MFLPILLNPVQLRDRHEDSFRDKRKSFFHRKMLCRDYHNGIHGVLFYLLYCIPISFSGRQISSWEFCFLSVIYYLIRPAYKSVMEELE